MITSERVSVPALETPPPNPNPPVGPTTFPLLIVMPEIVTVNAPTSNTRKLLTAAVARLTVNKPEPGPVIVMLSPITSSPLPLANSIVCTAGAKVIVPPEQTPPLIPDRSVPALPSSASVVTINGFAQDETT